MMTIQKLKDKVCSGENITREEALYLAETDVNELTKEANEIRKYFQGNDFDLCGVISCKSGQCSENCQFCSQSVCATVKVETQPWLSTKEILKHARLRDQQGVKHYCLVSVGKRASDMEIEKLCETIRVLCEETNLIPCASLGLLTEKQFSKLKEAGIKRIHNNLETSANYFSSICTSHTYEDKLETIKAAKRVGMELCCGGLIGIGETMEDRIDLALLLRELEPVSVPINLLDPVYGTPLGQMPHLDDLLVQKIIALFRFLLPKSYIRLAAGRDYLKDSGLSCFLSGSNAAITGDMLTVKGITVEKDVCAIRALGYS